MTKRLDEKKEPLSLQLKELLDRIRGENEALQKLIDGLKKQNEDHQISDYNKLSS